MKHNLFFIGVIVIYSINYTLLFSQDNFPVPLKDNSIYYEEVVNVDSLLKQNDLFSRAKLWVAQRYVTTATYNPIQLEDKDNGIIIIRISFGFTSSFFIHEYHVTVHCVGKIQVKDGRYRYTFSDFTYTEYSPTNKIVGTHGQAYSCDQMIIQSYSSNAKKLYYSYLSLIDNNMQEMITSLKASLNEPLQDDF